MTKNRLTKKEIENFTDEVKRNGFCVLRAHFAKEKLVRWNENFAPLLASYIEKHAASENRGKARYYVTLPFEDLFADEEIFADADILKIVENLVGEDFIMCQLATDTPLFGSEYQDIHRDAPPLFPEIKAETPAFQLAVNFPLVDVTPENGPFEVAPGTHILTKEDGMKMLETGEKRLEQILLSLGDVMIRDVRGLHRGTPNRTAQPRPMCVIGYSRKWLFRPEVSIRVPKRVRENLSTDARKMLRFNPVVESIKDQDPEEIYQSFAF